MLQEDYLLSFNMLPKIRLPLLKCAIAVGCIWAFVGIGMVHNRYTLDYEQYTQTVRNDDMHSSLTFPSVTNEEDCIRNTLKTIDQQRKDSRINRKTLHVLNAIYLKEGGEGIIDEWEVNFKSVLMNAPTDNDIHVHVLTNNAATKVVEERIRATGLLTMSRWQNKMSLTLHNVESQLDEWAAFLQQKTRGVSTDERVSIGGYFRLLAYKVLGKKGGVDEVVYMDTDVVIMSNLNDLMRYMNTTHEENENMIWQYAPTYANSGFMVLNMQKFHKFWELIDKLPEITHAGDQCLLSMVYEQWPDANYRGVLPDAWNTHLGHGWRRSPHELLHSGRNVGMLHFTGAFGETYFSEPGLEKYCDYKGRGKGCKGHLEEFRASWGLAEYYVRISWDYLMYFESSKISHDEAGYAFEFEVIDFYETEK